MLFRPFRKTVRFYRNRFASLFAAESPSLDEHHPRRSRTSSTRHRRLKRRHSPRPPLTLVVLAAISILLALYISVNRFIPPSWRLSRNRRPIRTANSGSNTNAVSQYLRHLHPGQARPPFSSIHEHVNANNKNSGSSSSGRAADAGSAGSGSDSGPGSGLANGGAVVAPQSGGETKDSRASHVLSSVSHQEGASSNGKSPASSSSSLSPAAGQQQQTRSNSDAFTRTCYHNPRSENVVCVHSPLCMRQATISYLAETLLCAPYSTINGGGDSSSGASNEFRTETLSKTRCVELERRLETEAEIAPIEHKSREWLSDLEARSRLLWFPRDAVLIRLPPHTGSIPQLAMRLLMLHHLIHNAHRYGLDSLTNIVIAAHPTVARKLRSSKSWHHGLLAAVIHPHVPLYSHAALEQQVAQQTDISPSSSMNSSSSSSPLSSGEGVNNRGLVVFVSNGMWGLSKARRVPCFRRVALPAAARSHFLLPADDFPGEISNANHDVTSSGSSETSSGNATRFRDAQLFRGQLLRSLGLDENNSRGGGGNTRLGFGQGPGQKRGGLGRVLIYLHRSTTRTLTGQGHTLLKRRLEMVANVARFELRVLDTKEMTFREQVAAMMDGAVVVGVHGTQMLNGLFLPLNASVVEIFPFGFSNKMVELALGPAVHYDSHQVVRGEHYGQLAQFGTVRECLSRSSDCRRWYQSDGRAIEFTEMDVAAVAALVERAIVRVQSQSGGDLA